MSALVTQIGCAGVTSASGSSGGSSSPSPSIAITISPDSANLRVGATQQFSANVSGTTNTAVVWAVTGAGCSAPNCGTISSNGLYVSPESVPSGTVTVTVTSVADTTRSASATLTIVALVSLAISPASAAVPTAGTQLFRATVTGSTDTSVTWRLSGANCDASACGSLSVSGSSAVYAAPTVALSPPNVSVIATSVGDPAISASAAVTIVPTIAVTVTPAQVSLSPGATQQFSASVTGTSNTAVAWAVSGTSCSGAACGTITTSGLYAAPLAALSGGAVTVTATSVANSSKSGTADVIVVSTSSVYYVDNCVTVGKDSNSGRSPSTPWLTMAKVNSVSLSPGDSILFQRTCTWRGTELLPSSSGKSGSPITFGAYGSGALPTISGASLLTNWTADGNYYYTAVSAQPNQVFWDNKLATSVASETSLATGTWWWDSANGRVYVYGNPSGHTVEASEAASAVEISPGVQYVTLRDLHFTKANQNGILLSDGYITIDGVTADYDYEAGLRSWTNANAVADNVVVENSTIAYNGGCGLVVGFVNNWTIQANDISHNSLDPTQVYTRGIYAGGLYTTNVTFQYNNVHDNLSHGIACDTCGTGIVIRYNNVWENGGWGIDVDADNGVTVDYNVSWNNLAGIYVFADANTSMTGMRIYNNTSYGNTNAGIWLEGPSAGPTQNGCTNNIVSNNIALNTTSGPNLSAFYGCENSGADGFGNVYTYNSFGAQAGNFIRWGGTNGAGVYESTYAAWETASGNCGSTGCSHSIQTAPLFSNAGTGSFTLASGSSAIGTGTNLGTAYQMALAPSTSWPAAVSTVNQNSFGSGWEIGAFVYVQPAQ